jgi:hypothetical protein
VAHQDVDSELAVFTSEAQDYRKEITVNFQYRGDMATTLSYLQVREKDGYHDLSLVTSPVFATLDWGAIKSDTYQLFQRDRAYDTQASFLEKLPPAAQLAVDKVAARDSGFKPGTYKPLEGLTSLEGINYVFTSAPPAQIIDGWYNFSKTFDATNASIYDKNKLNWALALPNQAKASESFHLGTVHINYQKIKPD